MPLFKAILRCWGTGAGALIDKIGILWYGYNKIGLGGKNENF